MLETIKENKAERVKFLLKRGNFTVVSFIEPEWEALPADPLRFFGLEPGFDSKRLKRAW